MKKSELDMQLYGTGITSLTLFLTMVLLLKRKDGPSDRTKHLLIKEQYPDLDIRFLFQNANNLLRKGSKTRYSDWCEKHGFLYAHKEIPNQWLTERKKRIKL